MPTGRIKTLVHLSQQTYVPGTRLAADHNDKGYGFIEDDDGREVFFSHELVSGLRGFDNLRRGQHLDYILEDAPYLRAASVRLVAAVAPKALRPGA
jgi:cold shock CspA family protein